ncbi:MAG: C-terminal target protein [Flavipsychrobacter sp.]|jgi:hypothetical protein|nr:C-terminal target protein [Flavipsychrobacter sp.]
MQYSRCVQCGYSFKLLIMKKLYLLVAICCMTLAGNATTWYSTLGSPTIHPVTDPTKWNSVSGGTGTPGSGPRSVFFGNPTDTFILENAMQLPDSISWRVAGTVIMRQAGITTGVILRSSKVDPDTISIGTALIMLSGTQVFSSPQDTVDLRVEMYGNLDVQADAFFRTARSTSLGDGFGLSYTKIHFCDTNASFFAPKTIKWGAITNADTAAGRHAFASLIFERRSFRKLLSDVTTPLLSEGGDSVLGTLICDNFRLRGMDSDPFTVDSGAHIYTTNQYGIDTTIQQFNAVSLSPEAHYHYNGSTAQVTGTTLPATFIAPGSVTVTNRVGVTLSQATAFDTGAAVNLDKGNFIIASLLTMNNDSRVNVDSGNFASSPTYNSFVHVTYKAIEYDSSFIMTTGNELKPVALNTSIGDLMVDKRRPGSTIIMGSDVTVNGDVLLAAGTFDSDGSLYWDIEANGNWFNNAGLSAFVNNGDSVRFGGSSPQIIGGAFMTTFSTLEVNSTGGVILGTEAQVDGMLALTNGTLDVDVNDLILGYSVAAVAGTFSPTTKIIAASSGKVRKLLYFDEPYFFPIGDAVGYSPISIDNLVSLGTGPMAEMAVNLVPMKHPNNANFTNHLKRYWRIYTTDITAPDMAVTAKYHDPLDVVGADGLISAGQYTGTLPPWLKFGPANTATDVLTFPSITDFPAEITGISAPAPDVTAAADRRICSDLAGGTTTTLTATASTSLDLPLKYEWSPSTDLSVTTGLVTIVDPTASGITTYTITVTDGNGFTGYATTTVTVDLSPVLRPGFTDEVSTFGSVLPDAACAGDILYLNSFVDNAPNYQWSGPVAITTGATLANAEVANVTPSASGVYTLSVNNGTDPGCAAVYTTNMVTINPVPSAPIVTTPGGLSEYCLETTINAVPVSTAGGEIVYYQGTTSGGFSLVDAFENVAVSVSDTYYFRIQDGNYCWSAEASKAVTINPLPAVYKMTGGGRYCGYDTATGVHIGMEMTDIGTEYYLYDPASVTVATVTGTGGPVDFGKFTDAGLYSASAKNITTGCTNLMDSVTTLTGLQVEVYKVDLPTPHNMTGGGGYCISGPHSSGRPIGLETSDYFISYQLYYRDNTMGAVFNPIGTPEMGAGVGFDFNFGLPYTGEGVYMVLATNSDGCIDTMATTDSIWINPLPAVFNVVTLDTAICAGPPLGPHIVLGNSDSPYVNYQLYENGVAMGTPQPGTNGTIDYGVYPIYPTYEVPGVYVYTVQATDANTLCVSDMTGYVSVTVNPVPIDFTMIPGGRHYWCTGAPVTVPMVLGGSELGIRYELFKNYVTTGVTIDGDGITYPDFGLFTSSLSYEYYDVIATNLVTGCKRYTTPGTGTEILENMLPYVDTLKGGGHYCNGVPPGVNISNTGLAALFVPDVQYFLYNEFTGLVGIYPAADFGDHMGPGKYYAIARNMATGCEIPLHDTVTIVIDSLPHVQNVIGGGAYCVNDTTAHHIGILNSQTGIDYEVFRDGSTSVGIFPGTGTAIDFGTTVVTGTYSVVATNTVTGCVSNMLGAPSIIAHPIPVAYNVFGGGRYCEGSGGPFVMLDTSESLDFSYQLYRNGSIWGAPVFGAGGVGISFGPQDSAGVYTAVATNTVTGCINNMDSFAFVVIKPIPAEFAVAGGGPYCIGDTGRHVYLSGSLVGTQYQLYEGFTAIGSPMPGTGFGLDFGLFTAIGTYYVVAELASDSCKRNMIGSVTISINSLPPVYTVTGGGTICADSTGTTVMLSNSDVGVRYELFRGSTPVGMDIDGTGSSLTYGPLNVAGSYTIVAKDLTTACISNMTGSATVSVNPLPTAYSITGGGDFCYGDGGRFIGLAGSEIGVLYQLRKVDGDTAVGGPQLGLGTPITFGLIVPLGSSEVYHVTAENTTTGCRSTMTGTTTIVVNPLPNVFTVTGGGTYCAGGAGLPILLSGSQPGVSYQLYVAAGATGTPRLGTGTVINFGPQTAAGAYTVVATDTTTSCINNMTGTGNITIMPYVTPTVTLTANPGTVISVGQLDTVVATVTGGGTGTPTFAWRINGNPVPGANTNTLVFTIYFDADTIECDVTSSGMCGGITTTKQIIIRLRPASVKELASLNGSLRLIPNPNKGAFSLQGNIGAVNNGELDIEVTNMLGQSVYRGKATAKNGEVDERIQLNGNLANGMYLLNVRSENASGVFHFVVEQ